MKKKIIFLLLILVVNISFLFSGPPDSKGPNSYCHHQYVWLNKYMGVPVNCDEFIIIGGAVRPAYLLEKGFQRQDRPGYIILGTVIGYSIYYALSPFHTTMKSFAGKKLSGQFSSRELEKAVLYGSVYTGFIIINIAVLFFSLLLFEKIIVLVSGTWKNRDWLLWLCLVMLISNQVCKIYFWSAHMQMFTIFSPIACIYAGLTIYNHPSAGRKSLLLAWIAGLLLLVYGNFVLLLPVIVFSYSLKSRKDLKAFSRSSFLTILAIITIFLLPTMAWISYLRLNGVTYYNLEVTLYRHFVWIADAWQKSPGHFFQTFGYNTLEFLKTSGSLFLSILFFAGVLAGRYWQQKKQKKINDRAPDDPFNRIVALSILLFVIFFWLIGVYVDRLTFSLAPFIVFTACRYINEQKLGINIQYGLGALIILIHFYTIFFNAPHLSEKLFFQ